MWLGARLSWDVLASCLHLASGLFPFHVTFICWSLHVACGLQHGRQTPYVVPEGFRDIGVEAALPSEGLGLSEHHFHHILLFKASWQVCFAFRGMKNGRHGSLGATLPHSPFRTLVLFPLAMPYDQTTFTTSLAGITFGPFLGSP